MKKKQAIQSSIEEMDARLQKERIEKEQEEVSKRKDIARPSLIKRIGVAILDFVFAAAFAGALFALSYFTIFPSLGYQKASEEIMTFYTNSSLFVSNNGNFETITKHYDEAKTPEQNYDVPITRFYKLNKRAIDDNKLEEYNNRKLESGLYELDGENNFVRKEGKSAKDVLPFLEGEYDSTLEYFYQDPDLISNSRLTFNVMTYSLLIIISASSGVFYFLIPLVNKRRQTLAYLIAKLIPVTGDEMRLPSRPMIALRSLIFVIISYISPLTISVFFTNGIAFAFIPFFINTAILSFSHSNSGLHDYASHIFVINLSHSNPFETLKSITGKGE